MKPTRASLCLLLLAVLALSPVARQAHPAAPAQRPHRSPIDLALVARRTCPGR